ncbi:MAG: hypothetical protein FAF05_07450 [Epsilonproteobacteria bacterium]|nr:hypothetical protein [Campylobacterota bacterium]
MIKLLVLALVLLSGCSYFQVTGTMCDNIETKGGEVPQECQVYNEEQATKAFNKVSDDQKVSHKDLEFDAEKNEQ